MTQQSINYGAVPEDGTGDGQRVAFKKVDDNFNENYPAIALNTAKVTNVITDLTEGTSTTTTVDVNSSDGTNATLVSASTLRAGLLTKAKFDDIVANKADIAALDPPQSSGVDPTFAVVTGAILTNNIRKGSEIILLQFSGTMSYSTATIASGTTIMNVAGGAFDPVPLEDIRGFLFIDVGSGYVAVKIKYTTGKAIVLEEVSPIIGTTEPFSINLVF